VLFEFPRVRQRVQIPPCLRTVVERMHGGSRMIALRYYSRVSFNVKRLQVTGQA